MNEAYYHTKASVDEYIDLAKGIDGKLLIEKLKRFLPSGSSLLEIGSGPGKDWQILNEYFNTTGSDNSAEFLSRLTENNPNNEFFELNASALQTDKKFAGIYSNKVMHHLKDQELEASVKRQYEILKSEGIICHSFWAGTGTETYKGMFVNYHSKTELKHFFENYFEILLIENYKEFEENDSIVLIGKKK